MKRNKGLRVAGGYNVSEIRLERSNILNRNSPFSIVEEYKALRTNLMFSTTVDGCKIIGVTSAEAFEGKSITCLNLAITFAEADKRVLLIDGDLRMPKVSRLLGIQSTPGLSNVLVNMNSADEIIEHVKLDKAGIDVVRSGDIPPNPSELLGSEKMAALLKTLSERYDYIFVDTPPATVVTDALVLSKQLTGLILVVRAGRTEQAAVAAVLDRLEYAGANIMGFVLNGVSEKNVRRYGKYKYYGKYKLYGNYKYDGQNQASGEEQAR